MINTEIEDLEEFELTYPYIGIHKDTSTIVLFTELNTGVVLKGDIQIEKEETYEDEDDVIGVYRTNWNEKEAFTKYLGKVILKNQ